MIEKTVAFIGGDKRQLFAAKAFAGVGYKVYLVGFDNLKSYGDLIITNINYALDNSSVVIFPVTGIKGNTVPTYFSDLELKLTEETIEKLKNKSVFSGKACTLKALEPSLIVYDYLQREEFAVANALPTAEGAVQIAMEVYEGIISGARCLVIGYGRIGKILSRMLKTLNAKVTVSARKERHYQCIKNDGNKPIKTESISQLKDFDIVFNTVPKQVIDNAVLVNTNPDTLIIDLASLPGGVDFSAAEKLNITAVRALSLPGKCSPKTAGYIISDTILNMLKEEYRWQKLI